MRRPARSTSRACWAPLDCSTTARSSPSATRPSAAFLENAPDADPTVASIIAAGRDITADAYVTDRARLATARVAALRLLDGCDLLLLPTTTEHPTIAAVRADPVAINRRLGTYTNFVNLLDLAAVAIPAGEADGGPFGVTVLARAFDDQLAVDLAARLLGTAGGLVVAGGTEVLVVGAHLRGQPLNGSSSRSAPGSSGRSARPTRTASSPSTRSRASPVCSGSAPARERRSAGEVWRLSPAALGQFLADLPAPMSLGRVELSDGSWVVGFGCTAEAGAAGTDITATGGWLAALAAGL